MVKRDEILRSGTNGLLEFSQEGRVVTKVWSIRFLRPNNYQDAHPFCRTRVNNPRYFSLHANPFKSIVIFVRHLLS
ncbi:MAG: hypothetical protein ACI9G1_005297 [Pirellulaceae bacterium]|jgi:hypothetical protein